MELLVWADAAAYCGLPTNYFKNLVKAGGGPTYIKPSPKKVLFRKVDLDLWVNSWATVEPVTK